MSNKELAINIIENIPESQMGYILNMLQNFQMALEDAADDAFCQRLYEDYLNDDDPEKNEGIEIEKFAEDLGISL